MKLSPTRVIRAMISYPPLDMSYFIGFMSEFTRFFRSFFLLILCTRKSDRRSDALFIAYFLSPVPISVAPARIAIHVPFNLLF